MSETTKIGVVGCGNISGAYFNMCQKLDALEVVSVADLDAERARVTADRYEVPNALSTEELLAHDAVDIVLNLTIPAAHVEVAQAALDHGKHCYMEKPLGIDRADAKQLVDRVAASDGLRVGCAPDTFMGAGIQTARKLIDDGALGEITAFNAFLVGRGHETWHPSPEFYYQPGGGPMLDMGPYYLTALLNLLGPVRRVAGMTTIGIPTRTITSEAKRGKTIQVETPDHYCGTIEFESGVVGSIIQSFAMRNAPQIEPFVVYGTEATMRVPDPNQFDKEVYLKRESIGDDGKPNAADWQEVPFTHPTGYGRSAGLLDMALAIQKGRPHRCSLEQAFTVLDMMQGFHDSSESGTFHTVAADYERPAPMPTDKPFGVLD
ncbi:MAG: Gfo/Idh/MocA family oxidoreductase [Planctomycetota bacterium]